MAEVDVFLNEEWPALGDAEALEKQLEQCTVRTVFIYLALNKVYTPKLGTADAIVIQSKMC